MLTPGRAPSYRHSQRVLGDVRSVAADPDGWRHTATEGKRAGVSLRPAQRTMALAIALATCVVACEMSTPLQPGNRSPVVQSLVAFPTTLGPGDSAIVVCGATDPDGDTMVYDWSSDCRLLKKGDGRGGFTIYEQGRSLVVYAGACNRAPIDTGWISCDVRDHKGGMASSRPVLIVVRQ